MHLALWWLATKLYLWITSYILSPATVVNFEQATYSVDESDGSVQPVLVLSKPSSYDTYLQVLAGKHWLY